MTHAQSRYRLMLATTGALFCAVAAPAYAQEASAPPANAAPATQADQQDTLQDIIVTASKRGDESLRNVPLAIQALTGDTLANAGITQFSEYATRVPSLAFQDLGPGDKKFIIRGINSSGAATVGAYYDEAVISADNRNDQL